MMDKNKVLALIEIVHLELKKGAEDTIFLGDDRHIQDTIKVIDLLMKELECNIINERVLRAMHDIGMSAYKIFESTKVEVALNNLIEELYNSVPEYRYLEPLRNDFGKGNPI